MARVACVDSNAVTRRELRALLENAHQECRNSIGYLEPAQYIEGSKEQCIISSPPDVIVIGPGFTVEETFNTCREIKATHPTTPLAVLLTPNNYSLRAIKRLEKHAQAILLTDDQPVRLIHEIDSLRQLNATFPTGKLVTCIGVKGGVGTTSVVSGLAHAAEALGTTAVVVDLSPQSAFPFYMGASSWQSPDYRYLLMERTSPDASSLRKILTVAPNGINILLPPSGGVDIRELWLRNDECFEITLSMIDLLREEFELVIVDIGCVEGVLPFALNTNAAARLVISSNDPASVHLLRNTLATLKEIPGDSTSFVLINELCSHGIDTKDINDFLVNQEELLDSTALRTPLPFDSQAGAWIGSGNSFYTEASKYTQSILEETLVGLNVSQEHIKSISLPKISLFEEIRSLLSSTKQTNNSLQPRKALPPTSLPPTLSSNDNNNNLNQIHINKNVSSTAHNESLTETDMTDEYQETAVLFQNAKIVND